MTFPKVRPAETRDAENVHALGRTIPELRVSDEGDFMSLEEIASAIADPRGVFLVLDTFAKLPPIRGFAYARIDDLDRGAPDDGQACFVYLVVHAKDRRCGLGDALCKSMLMELALRRVRHVYTWANPRSGVIEFMERHGFAKGHACVWMDRSL